MTTSDARRLISLPVALLALAACGAPEDRAARATDEDAPSPPDLSGGVVGS